MHDLGLTSGSEHLTWSKSTHSATSNACVEVAVTSQVVGVRDTKDRDGGTLAFDRHAWSAFTNFVKADDLSH